MSELLNEYPLTLIAGAFAFIKTKPKGRKTRIVMDEEDVVEAERAMAMRTKEQAQDAAYALRSKMIQLEGKLAWYANRERKVLEILDEDHGDSHSMTTTCWMDFFGEQLCDIQDLIEANFEDVVKEAQK